ncbi:hypothetical protein ZIOFF_027816 [Zingiber officinale]|uniref:Uncharacterized protein n=1 Tax=Zingiber officinale TaxID=94328 RepID=A0A8J5GZ05_ZINOF|nr:hypothetical protein ZIOFF_027816 [Zingiber officinale]
MVAQAMDHPQTRMVGSTNHSKSMLARAIKAWKSIKHTILIQNMKSNPVNPIPSKTHPKSRFAASSSTKSSSYRDADPRQRRAAMVLGHDLTRLERKRKEARERGNLAVAVPFVCKSWYRASLDPSCWRRLNFRSLDFTPWSPFSRAFALRYRLHSPLSFSAFLRFALHRTRVVVDQLAFPLSSAVSIHDLAYASVKCLRLKALALPDNLMLEDDLRILELVWRWKDLEHLEMETKPSSFLEAIA